MCLRTAQVILLLLLAALCPGLTEASPIADTSPLVPRAVSACKLPADNSVFMSVGFGRGSHCLHSVGTVTGFMLFVDFPDSPSAENSGQETYDLFFPDAANWFKYASYSRLRLEVTSDTRFYRMTSSSASWDWEGPSFTDDMGYEYIQEAVHAYEAANGQRIPTVDILYIVPTASARAISVSVAWYYPVNRTDGSPIAKKIVTMGVDALSPWGGFVVLIHETGHVLCLPDLYPAHATIKNGQGGRFVGGFDVMGMGTGPSPDLFAWDKWRLGWIGNNDIDCVRATLRRPSRHVLTPLYRDMPGKKAVVIVNNGKNALVAEYRLDGGLDTATCSPGLLLYIVDPGIADLMGPIRVIDANPGTNGCDRQPLNDATLSMDRTRSIRVAQFGVDIKVVAQSYTAIVFYVEYYDD